MPGDRSSSLPIAALINRLQERGLGVAPPHPGWSSTELIGAPISERPFLLPSRFSEVSVFLYTFRRRHHSRPRPTSPVPRSAREAGSGTSAGVENLHYLDVSGHGFHRDASTAPRGGIPYALVREPWHRRKSGCLAASVCERTAQLRERAAYGRLNKEVEGFTALYGADDGIRDDCAPGADENQ